MNSETAIAVGIYANIPVLMALGGLLWVMIQRLTAVETALKYVDKRLGRIERDRDNGQ